MDMLVTTDYAVQEGQEDIEVWHFAHAALPYIRTRLHSAVHCCNSPVI